MTRDQEWAWLRAQDEARQHLAAGVHTLRGSKFMDPVRESVLSTWAIGAEKLLKVAIGLHGLSLGAGWPSKSTMMSYKHQIERLDDELSAAIHSWMGRESRGGYLRAVVERVDDDPVWASLRVALGLYGDQGRFRSLDALSGSTQTKANPYEAWEAAVQAAWKTSSRMERWRARDMVTMQAAEFDQQSLDLHAAVTDSLVNWWFMITRLARHGFLGERGRLFGADAEPQNALPPVEVLEVTY